MNKKQKSPFRLKKIYILSIVALVSSFIFYLVIISPSSLPNKYDAIGKVNTLNFQVTSARMYFLKLKSSNNFSDFDTMKAFLIKGNKAFDELNRTLNHIYYLKFDSNLQSRMNNIKALMERIQKDIISFELNNAEEEKVKLEVRWELVFNNFSKNISEIIWEIENLSKIEKKKNASNGISAISLIVFFTIVFIYYLYKHENKKSKKHLALKESERKFKHLFDKSPVPMWEEDFTDLMKYIHEKKDSGTTNFRKYFDDNPSEIEICINKIKILDVNQASLNLFKAKNKEYLLNNLANTFTDNSWSLFKNEIITLAEGKNEFYFESNAKSLSGEILLIAFEGYINRDFHDDKTIVILATYNLTDKRKIELLYEEKRTHEIVISLLQFANKTKSEDELKEKFFEIVHKIINYRVGIFCEISNGTRILFVKSFDENIESFSEEMWTDNIETQNLINQVVFSQSSMIRNNTFLENSVKKSSTEPIVNNFLGIPLKLNKIIFGVVALINNDRNFTELDKEKIKILSSVFSEALEKKRLDSQIINQQNELEELVNKRTVELKNTNLKLLDEKNKAENYLNVANVMMVAIDNLGKIVLLNNEGYNILECKRGEIIGEDWFLKFVDKNNRAVERERINNIFKFKNVKIETYESIVITCSGKTKTILWYYSIVKNQSGEIQSVLFSGTDITELKRKNKELRKLNHDLRRANGIAKLGNWQFNVSSDRITWTSQVYEIFGIHENKCITKEYFISLLHKDDRWILKKIFSSNNIPLDVKEVIFRVKYKNNLRYINSIIEKAWDKNGITTDVFGVIQDITDEMKTEKELKESEERYKTISDTAFYGVIIHKKGEIVFANPKAEELYDFINKKSLVGKNVLDLVHKDDRKFVKKRTKQIYADEEHEQVAIIKLLNIKGETITAEVSSTKIKFENEVALQVTINDISREVQRESQMNLLMRAMHQSGPGIVVTNTSGEIEYVNSKYEKLTKFSSEELIGTQLSILNNVEENSELYIDIINKMTLGKTWQGELNDFTKERNIFWASVSISPMYKNGKMISFLTIIDDITEKKRMLEKLKIQKEKIEKQNEGLEEKIKERTSELLNENIKRQAAEARIHESLQKEKKLSLLKSQFISTATHDFKTPLSVIRSSVGILVKYGEKFGREKHLYHLNLIEDHVKNLLNSINEVIKIGESERAIVKFNPEEISIESFARSIKKGIDITLNENQDTICFWDFKQEKIVIDTNLLKTILSNLLSNAIKYSPNGGLIQWNMFTSNNILKIEIADEGIGISKENLTKLFSPYFRAEEIRGIAGSGVGLFHVKQAVEEHNGEIRVESKINKGSNFFVTIPC